MSEEITIENFYSKAKSGKLFASQCIDCGKLSLPPRKICPVCYSTKATWRELGNEGIIESFTIIHVPPKRFEHEVPYGVCLIELNEGIKVLARTTMLEKLKIGQKVKLKIIDAQRNEWPDWPYFTIE
ncbi:MAG TPA: Zn-ribbon domain-containing OB-fold protein [Geobacterales bacterium]|nr:Zn-ribbon domain-containing OB-fold protein [Geobacterales bacterium]